MSRPAAAARAFDLSWRLDAVGGALVLAFMVWVVVVSRVAGGDPRPLVGLVLVAAASYATGRLMGLVHPWAAPLLVVGAAAGLALAAGGDLLARPLGNPLGYSNAVGALYVQASAAAFVVAVRSRAPALTAAGVVAAVAFAAVPWLNGTTTAAVMTVVLAVTALLAAGRRRLRVRLLAAVGAAAVALAMAATAWLGATYDPERREGRLARAVDVSLSERRPQLWGYGLEVMRTAPWTGAGPGRFAETARDRFADEDAARTHQEVLQVGAETGLAGALLALALLGWSFLRLAGGPEDAGNTIAVVGLTALGVHASVDYVLHFAEVVAAAGSLVGAGSVLPPPAPRR